VTPKGLNKKKMKLTKRILVVLSVMNVQVLDTSEQIVKTSNRLKVRLSMPLSMMILMKKRL
jgi:hypothetical protein